VSVLYCAVPHFVAELARRDRPALGEGPLVVMGPAGRVLGVSAEAAAGGVTAGMAAREAEVRCPEARLLVADPARLRAASEVLLGLLERASPRVEAHGWGAAYADMGDELQTQARAVALLREVGRGIRGEMGDRLQPALGWDSTKFTAQAAARRTPPGHLRAVDARRQRAFLHPLPVGLLPLGADSLQRLRFLGLRSLGQYAALPAGAVWQQFGRAGMLARRCARGEDDRPVVPRDRAPQLSAAIEFDPPLVDRARLVAALAHLVGPLLAELRANLQACDRLRLAVTFDDGGRGDPAVQERERAFLLPVSEEGRVVEALGRLLDGLRWPGPAAGLAVTLAGIQEAVAEQLALFPLEDERAEALQQVGRYLAARFGANCLRRAVLARPGAPLPEWRTGWLEGEGG
jgi:nucleotidyltransferase/DNA polymerase involved in DNA repair